MNSNNNMCPARWQCQLTVVTLQATLELCNTRTRTVLESRYGRMFLEWNIKSIVLIINGSTVLWASWKYRHRRKEDACEGLDSPIYPSTFWLKIAGTSKACMCKLKDHAASIPYTRNRTFVRERFRREFTNSEAGGNTFSSAKVSGDTHEITQVYRLL